MSIENSYKRLDSILNYLNDAYANGAEGRDLPLLAFGWRLKRDIQQNVEWGNEEHFWQDVEQMLLHLANVEHYISEDGRADNNYTRYRILYAGKIFIENGGYTRQLESSQQKETWETALSEASKKNAERLNDLTFWLAVATSLLFLLEFVKFSIAYLW